MVREDREGTIERGDYNISIWICSQGCILKKGKIDNLVHAILEEALAWRDVVGGVEDAVVHPEAAHQQQRQDLKKSSELSQNPVFRPQYPEIYGYQPDIRKFIL